MALSISQNPPFDPADPAAALPSNFPEWAKNATSGQLLMVSQLALEEAQRRLNSADAAEDFARWEKPEHQNPADWNTHLASDSVDEDSEDGALITPDNFHDTLPFMTKMVENIDQTVTGLRAVLFNQNKRAIDASEHEELLGVRVPASGPYRMEDYYEVGFQLTRKEARQLQKFAETYFRHVPEPSVGALLRDHPAGEMVEAPLKHFGAAITEVSTEQDLDVFMHSFDPERPSNGGHSVVDTASWLTRSPWLNHKISMANLEAMRKFYEKMQTYAEDSGVEPEYFAEIMGAFEKYFVEPARQLSSRAFKKFLREHEQLVKDKLSQDGPEPPEEEEKPAEEEPRDYLHMWEQEDGSIEFNGRVHGERAEALRTLKYQLDRYIRHDRKDGKKSAEPQPVPGPLVLGEEDGDGTLPIDDSLVLPDTASADLTGDDVLAEYEDGTQVSADSGGYWLEDRLPEEALAHGFIAVLLAGFRAGADNNGIPRNRGADTTMIVTMNYDTLLEQTKSHLRRDTDPPPDGPEQRSPFYRSGSQFGTLQDPAQLRALMCDAKILPLVFGGESVPLDLGRAERLYNHDQYTALVARDGGCTVPGCTMPAIWCQMHHALEWWEHGGETNLDNATLICPRHHTQIHQGKWKIVRIDQDGVWYQPASWFNPDPTLVRNRVWDSTKY